MPGNNCEPLALLSAERAPSAYRHARRNLGASQRATGRRGAWYLSAGRALALAARRRGHRRAGELVAESRPWGARGERPAVRAGADRPAPSRRPANGSTPSQDRRPTARSQARSTSRRDREPDHMSDRCAPSPTSPMRRGRLPDSAAAASAWTAMRDRPIPSQRRTVERDTSRRWADRCQAFRHRS